MEGIVMTTRELKYTYIEEAMSILDNEEMMEKMLKTLRRTKKALSKEKTEESYLREAISDIKKLKEGKLTTIPLQDLLNEL